MIGELAVFDERVVVEQEIEPLAYGELAELTLSRHSFGAPHGEGGVLALGDIVDERLPVVEIVGHGAKLFRMLRPVVASALCALLLLAACSDDKKPAARPGGGASASAASGSEATVARSMARVLADGLVQGANGRISASQADCLVNEIASRVRPKTLTEIASDQPEPKSLDKDVRASFAAAFDRCLPHDIADQLKQQLGA